jgi:RecQ family ATP-dependent DNA helicase
MTNTNEIMSTYNDILYKHFGYSTLKDLQYEIIKYIIDSEDVISLLPTSYGKSICYQMPYLITKKNVIVVSPLISLMEDQMRELNEKNIPSRCLNSSNKQKMKDITELYNGETKIIYTTPEYLSCNPNLITNLAFIDKLALIAIDECHCISSWGHSFRVEYQNLAYIKDIAPEIPILALTATATNKVIKDVIKNLNLVDPKIVKHSVDRPNLYIEIQQRDKDTLEKKIVPLLHEQINKGDGKILIYCKTTKDTDKVAEKLQNLNFKCEAYHAKKDIKIRTKIQSMFTNNELNIITSTIAFGMGINIPNIRLMIHYNCSNDVESYMQEIGRAGRDGKQSKCYMFFSNQDFLLSYTFLDEIKDAKIKQYKCEDINYLKKYVSTSQCRRNFILKYFDENIDNCQNCDNCLNKKYIRDFTKEMYLLLSLMTTFTSNFGMNTYIKLLLGSKEKNLEKYSTIAKNYFGKGNEYSNEWWKHLFGLLFNNGYLIEEQIKHDKFICAIIKPTSKSMTWFNLYKHEDMNKKPIFEILVPIEFQQIDKKKTGDKQIIDEIKNAFAIPDKKIKIKKIK